VKERRNTTLERQQLSPGLKYPSAVRQRDAAQLFSPEKLLINAQNISRSKEVIRFYVFLETSSRTFHACRKLPGLRIELLNDTNDGLFDEPLFNLESPIRMRCAGDADVRQLLRDGSGVAFGEIAPGFRSMATPLRSRHCRVGAKAFGVSAPGRDSPKVFAPGGSGSDGQPAFAGDGRLFSNRDETSRRSGAASRA
jgi:hypothetical protein